MKPNNNLRGAVRMSISNVQIEQHEAFLCVQAAELTYNDLLDLCTGKIQALQIKKYYPKEIAEKISERILAAETGYYINAPSIGRIGMAYFEASGKDALLQNYYGDANSNINSIRNFFTPYYSPLDRFRLELQERWLHGCNIENIHDKQMFVGLCRVVDENIDFLPHQDIFSRDATDNKIASSLLSQLSVNIYLQMAPKGGELEMWDLLMSTEEYDRIRQGNYGLPRKAIDGADLTVMPETGDLILFNAKKFHAVRPSFGEKRISISCFVGFKGIHKPLTVWS